MALKGADAERCLQGPWKKVGTRQGVERVGHEAEGPEGSVHRGGCGGRGGRGLRRPAPCHAARQLVCAGAGTLHTNTLLSYRCQDMHKTGQAPMHLYGAHAGLDHACNMRRRRRSSPEYGGTHVRAGSPGLAWLHAREQLRIGGWGEGWSCLATVLTLYAVILT